MLVVGIDPGIAITGYGFIHENEQGDIEVIDFGVVRTPANTPVSERLNKLYLELMSLIRLHRPNCAAVEKLFFQKNVRTAINVGQARGVALLALSQVNLPVFEYSPNEIKQAITGYGGADKKQIQTMVKVILELEEIPQPDDAADALAVALCHLQSAKMRQLVDNS